MENLRKIRESHKITQADLAKMLSVDRTTVVKWETSNYFPRASMLPALARILDCSIEDLLCPKTCSKRTKPA